MLTSQISDAGTFGRPARATDVAAHASTDVDEVSCSCFQKRGNSQN